MIANRFGQLVAIMATVFLAGHAFAAPDAATMLDPGESPPSSPPPGNDPPPPPPGNGEAYGVDEALTGFESQYCLDLCGDANSDGVPDHQRINGTLTARSGESHQCKIVGQTQVVGTVTSPVNFTCYWNSEIGFSSQGIYVDINDNVSGFAVKFDHVTVDNSGRAEGSVRHSETHGHGYKIFQPNNRDVVEFNWSRFRGGARHGTGSATVKNSYMSDVCIYPTTHAESWQLPFGGGLRMENVTSRGNRAPWCHDIASASGHFVIQTSSGGNGGPVTLINNLFDTYMNFGIWMTVGPDGGDRFGPVTVTGNRWTNDFSGAAFGTSGNNICSGSWNWSDNRFLNGSSVGNPCP